jgi:hypothetical protein
MFESMIKVFLLAIAISAILSVVIATTATQKALADKVGPLGEDAEKQGGLGEFFSKAGKDHYFGVNGHTFGQVRAGLAKSSPNLIGANTGFYGSGECHSTKHPEACS